MVGPDHGVPDRKREVAVENPMKAAPAAQTKALPVAQPAINPGNPDSLPLPIAQAAGSVQPLEDKRPDGDLDKGIPNPVLPKLHNPVYQAGYHLAADDAARIARVLTPNTKKCFVEAPLAP